MVGDLINRISDSAYGLSLHSDEGYYLESFSNKFTASEKELLFHFDISQALKYTDLCIDDYLYFTYGVYDTRDLNNVHFGQLLSELFIDYKASEIKQEDIANALSKPNNLTDSPAFCANVLSKRSFHEVCIFHVLADAKDLAFDADDNPRLDNERSFDDIIDEFWFYARGEGRLALDRAWSNYGRFLEKVNVEHKHPLYATNYALALTPIHQELISNPIEQIIIEAANHPAILHKITPRDFEKVITQIFEGFGFTVELTAQTRDGGADIICFSYSHGIPFKVAVEVKRYSPERPVSIELIRGFVGANEVIKANKLVYVTTSRYTKDAVKYSTTPFLTSLIELKALPDVQR